VYLIEKTGLCRGSMVDVWGASHGRRSPSEAARAFRVGRAALREIADRDGGFVTAVASVVDCPEMDTSGDPDARCPVRDPSARCPDGDGSETSTRNRTNCSPASAPSRLTPSSSAVSSTWSAPRSTKIWGLERVLQLGPSTAEWRRPILSARSVLRSTSLNASSFLTSSLRPKGQEKGNVPIAAIRRERKSRKFGATGRFPQPAHQRSGAKPEVVWQNGRFTSASSLASPGCEGQVRSPVTSKEG